MPSHHETIVRIKQEILEDVKAGIVPYNCISFSALHDYVDANEYGGFCEDELVDSLFDHFREGDKNEGMPQKMIAYFNEAQNTIDLWLKDSGIEKYMALNTSHSNS